MFSKNKSRLFYLIILFFALMSANVHAVPPLNTYRSKTNVSGGENYYSVRGQYLGRSTKNTFSGKNYYSSRGYIYAQTNKYETRIGSKNTPSQYYYNKSKSATRSSSKVSKSIGVSKSSTSSKGK